MVGAEKHATVRLYWIFAAILCAITFVEWLVFRDHELRAAHQIIVPLLLALSLTKFIMVCGWYMHLRFDHKWLWQIFAGALLMVGMVFALTIFALR